MSYSQEDNMKRARRSSLGVGILLIALGLLVLVGQLFPGIFGWGGPITWPLIVVGVGIFLLLLGLATGNPGMAVPACIVGGIGVLLYWQNATQNFGSWAYAWTLISGFAGVGVILEGLFTGRFGKALVRGGWMILVSLVMFTVFASFLGGPKLLGIYWPALLILLGLISLVQYFMQTRR
jgi:hypothetical protein